MSNKFRKKNSEVEAIQLNPQTIGAIIDKLAVITNQTNFEINWSPFSGVTQFAVTFEDLRIKPDSAAKVTIVVGNYVVFDSDDYDILLELQFKEMFEPVPEVQIDLRRPLTNPSPFSPYQPKTVPYDQLPWQQIIVTD